MKTLVVELPDEVYERAQRRALQLGTTIDNEVGSHLAQFSLPVLKPSSVEFRFEDELSEIIDENRSASQDGRFSAPIAEATILHARRLVAALPIDIAPPSLGVEPDGHLTFEWYRNARWLISISVSPEAELFYAGLFDSSDVRGREIFGDTIPDVLLSLIRRV